MSKEGEVERKVRELGDEIFARFNPGKTNLNAEGKEWISKENLREFIMEIMQASNEQAAWDETEFE